jgi:hypothetical protein
MTYDTTFWVIQATTFTIANTAMAFVVKDYFRANKKLRILFLIPPIAFMLSLVIGFRVLAKNAVTYFED